MFEKILIANRGEIALRVLRACKELGIPTVAVHSTADADAMHVRLADESVCIGPPRREGKLSQRPGAPLRLRNHRRRRGASGLRLSVRECALCRNPRANTASTSSVRSPNTSALMGDKIEAKRTAQKLGIPVVPGSDGGINSDQRCARDRARHRLSGADEGGGRRRRPRHEGRRRPTANLPIALATARAEAKAAFGDDAVYLEKYLQTPRHIEIQVLGDGQAATRSISASATARCSAATRKFWRKAPRPRSTRQRATRSARSSPRRCAK